MTFLIEVHLETLLFWSLVFLSCVVSSFLGCVVLREATTYTTVRREMFGLFRSVLQTVLAVIIFRVYTTGFWWAGVFLTTAGTAVYWRAYMTFVSDQPTHAI
ncbi:hypothetical protein ACTXT7_010156 [Hymenolepis weldensis]